MTWGSAAGFCGDEDLPALGSHVPAVPMGQTGIPAGQLTQSPFSWVSTFLSVYLRLLCFWTMCPVPLSPLQTSL